MFRRIRAFLAFRTRVLLPSEWLSVGLLPSLGSDCLCVVLRSFLAPSSHPLLVSVLHPCLFPLSFPRFFHTPFALRSLLTKFVPTKIGQEVPGERGVCSVRDGST